MTTQPRMRLGDRLIDRGILTADRLRVALREQERFHRPLGEILISLGFVDEKDLVALAAEDHGLEFRTAAEIQPDPLLLSMLDPVFVRDARAFPYALEDGALRVVLVDPDDPQTIAHVRERFPYPLVPTLTTEKELGTLVRMHLDARSSRLTDLLSGAAEEDGTWSQVEEVVEALLTDAIYRGATDIHVEPEERVTRVRYRIDGILQGVDSLPSGMTNAVVSRIKVLSSLDISERRRPQDGRLRTKVGDKEVDTRVSIMPTQHGENVVLRLLDNSDGVLRLERLGLSSLQQTILREIASRPHGLFLVTGPTGSGKTTTLYAMLAEIDAVHRKVATVEDPIEYQMPLIRQSQIDPAIGFDFSSGLSALLRQDPDVILVGEIRDSATADIAIKAAMTGHLVLSTLHTNSSIQAFSRLAGMGVEQFLLEDSMIGAMSQRLARRVCSLCVETRPADERELEWLGVTQAEVRQGRGCEHCNQSGYQGRVAIIETFLPDEATLEALRAGRGLEQLERVASENGFLTLEEEGKKLVLDGRTTMEEVRRVASGARVSREAA